MRIIILVLIIISIGINIKLYRDKDELQNKYDLINELYSTLAEDMKKDCQYLLDVSKRFDQQVGCANAVERLCADNTKVPKTCYEQLKYVCEDI